MDVDIVLGGDLECHLNLAQASSRYLRSLVLTALDLLISFTHLPALEQLYIDCSNVLNLE
jgi:hypothetical protein